MRAGSLAAGARRSRPPAAPAEQRRAAAAHSAGRRPPPPSVHRPPPHAPAGCLHLRPPVEAGCRRPGARPAGGAAAEGRGGLWVRCARGRREVLPPRAARGGLQRCTRRPDGRDDRMGRRPTGGRAAGAKARGRGDELRQAQAGGGRGCGRVARLAWAAGQAATKPHANPRLCWAEA
ncbi:hypothetical protein PVAP13_9NG172473 [Panicum virgatum]|uniref:Uncharacterized protein n=1 Tax=Panicum virgatum TaxID=38727 RepID=A0A8T0MJG0_PANVG|nr:hypothetical protein PVAP13_9NG172473 [Panicum virgatum]